MKVNIRDAKTSFSKLLLRVALGEETTSTRVGLPVAHLVPVQPVNPKRELGIDRSASTLPTILTSLYRCDWNFGKLVF